nr:hypothetical protein Iba_chr04bCG11740 [Ipomoea batatas]
MWGRRLFVRHDMTYAESGSHCRLARKESAQNYNNGNLYRGPLCTPYQNVRMMSYVYFVSILCVFYFVSIFCVFYIDILCILDNHYVYSC